MLPWWLGWSVVMAVPFWFHHGLALPQRTLVRTQRVLIAIVYALGASMMALLIRMSRLLAGAAGRSPLLSSAQQPGPLFLFLGIFLVSGPACSLYSLGKAWRQATAPAIRRQFAILSWATLLAALTGAYTTASWRSLRRHDPGCGLLQRI
ncbi:MAG TPA: hypothetical protein VM537_15545 [Anaerolineae bacterium]|nr:hypothetical protein [Anaerolineae bacterium]